MFEEYGEESNEESGEESNEESGEESNEESGEESSEESGDDSTTSNRHIRKRPFDSSVTYVLSHVLFQPSCRLLISFVCVF